MRTFIYEALNSVNQRLVAPLYKSIGKSLYITGTKLEGQHGSQDRLVPSLRNLTYGGAQPSLEAADFVAPNSTILGNVTLGLNSSVWYGATLIGTKEIKVGSNSVIQDRSHLSSDVRIGDNVFVGPNCTIQGSVLDDYSFISMGATVRHAKVQYCGLVAAGAVLSDGVVVKQGEIWAGNPGKFLRNITPIERQVLRQHLDQMRDLAIVHSEETEKNSRQVISGLQQPYQAVIFEDQLQNLFTENNNFGAFPISQDDEQFSERRLIMRQTVYAPNQQPDYEPFEFNLSHLGQKFNLGVHNEAFKKVATKITKKERFTNDNDSWTKPF